VPRRRTWLIAGGGSLTACLVLLAFVLSYRHGVLGGPRPGSDSEMAPQTAPEVRSVQSTAPVAPTAPTASLTQSAQSAPPATLHASPTPPAEPAQASPAQRSTETKEPNYGGQFNRSKDKPTPPMGDLLERGHSVYWETPSKFPNELSNLHVITTWGLRDAIKGGGIDGVKFVLVDVLSNDHQITIASTKKPENSATKRFIDNYYYLTGDIDDTTQRTLERSLKLWTKKDLSMPIVFFCRGWQCFESYLACLRAGYLKFTRVYWFRGGLDAWEEATKEEPTEYPTMKTRLAETRNVQ
jgi:hypothetical protein